MLKQGKLKRLNNYYYKAFNFLIAAKKFDKINEVVLKILAIFLLNLTINKFVAKLKNPALRLRMLKYIKKSTTKLLKVAYV